MMQVGDDSMSNSHPFCMASHVADRPERTGEHRQSPRYEVDLAMRFRVLPASTVSEWRVGTVLALSSTGVSFQCGQPLPANTRIEMVIDWRSRQSTLRPICLPASGDAVRNSDRRVAVQITASRMGIERPRRSSKRSGSGL